MRWERVLLIGMLLLMVAGGVLYILRFQYSQAIFPLRGEYLKVDGSRLYITDQGQGRTVLFIHGFPYHAESFRALTANSWPGYRFVTIDLPGLGLSDKNVNKNITPEDLALVLKLVLDKMNIQEVDLVGHDLGGGVAVVFAASFPQMVRQVVLIAPDSSAGSAAEAMSGVWKIPVLGEAWATFRLNRGFIRDLLQRSWSPTATTWYEVVERYTRPLDSLNGRHGFLRVHRGRVGFDYLRYEERMKADCLIVWGKQDTIVPASRVNRLLQSFERARVEIIPNVGHVPQEEAPAEVSQRIKTFLEQAK